MGRHKKYKSEEEKKAAYCINAKKYYERNKEMIREKNKQRYHDAKKLSETN